MEIITTRDGSHSLFNKELNETYHSIHGAIQESEHVFIKHGFGSFLERFPNQSISILEVGFGTGLNTLLTLKRAIDLKVKVQYVSMKLILSWKKFGRN